MPLLVSRPNAFWPFGSENGVTRAADCEKSIGRWNKILEEEGSDVRVSLPSIRFNRIAGVYKGLHFDPRGNSLSTTDWEMNMGQWLPTKADREYVRSLMKQVTKPGQFANYIAPPKVGINRQPVDFEYVRL